MRALNHFAICAAGFIAVVIPASASAHGQGLSFASWTLEPGVASLAVTFQTHDLLRGVGWLDLDANGALSVAELEAGRARLARDLVAGVKLGRVDECRARTVRIAADAGETVAELQLRAEFTCSADGQWLDLGHDHLPTLEPPHLTHATIVTAGRTIEHQFGPAEPVLRIRLRRPSALRPWLDPHLNAAGGARLLILVLLALDAARRRAAAGVGGYLAALGAGAATGIDGLGFGVPVAIGLVVGPPIALGLERAWVPGGRGFATALAVLCGAAHGFVAAPSGGPTLFVPLALVGLWVWAMGSRFPLNTRTVRVVSLVALLGSAALMFVV